MKFIISIFTLSISVVSASQKLYPTHWWTGMKEQKLQLIIHHPDAAKAKFSMSPYSGVTLTKQHRLESPNYLIVDLNITGAKPGIIRFSLDGQSVPFELKQRNKGNGTTRNQGISAKDFVYLMMPDRFANGDPSNDIIPEYREQGTDRKNKFMHHGGDFKGIENRLDYFKELGVTALWMTPIVENNTSLMQEVGFSIAGYHGYWFTDHYQVDKRYGGNEGYKAFAAAAHGKGIKVIQDAIYNHIGKEHWINLDPPAKDWINNWTKPTYTNHRDEALIDPYASNHDKKVMLDGWFTDHLPDLNQRNPYVANFLIQHVIWSTEEFGVDGWRVDTYKYCDEPFLNRVNTALQKEFPSLTIFGEAWVNSITANAYFTKNNISAGFDHNANSVIDFQSCFAMLAGMNENFGWTNGVNKIYMTLAQDMLYKDPMKNCIFLDNHDMDRVFSVVGENWNKMKMGFNWLMTLRGIPQLYYGTEILMKNTKAKTDADVREDFPGGFPGDAVNKFVASGRTEAENISFNHLSSLARFRKSSSAITTGKLMQFIPRDGLYIYFRYDDKQTVMTISHTGTKPAKPDWNVYSERTGRFTKARDVVSGKTIQLSEIEMQPGESYVYELLK